MISCRSEVDRATIRAVKLPRADQAVVEPTKLHGYVLSTSHPVGRFKARFFERLGYSAEHWARFEADLRSQHLANDADELESTQYGQKYEIRAMLNGPTGQADVVSVWLIRHGESIPRFVTAYPGEPR